MQTITPSLSHPVFFVVTYADAWAELFSPSDAELPDPDTLYNRIKNNEDCWIILTYLHLKRKGLNVFISDKFVPGQICVASTLDFGVRALFSNAFIVGCRGDGFKTHLCNFSIVQNKANLESETDALVPLWPQPGLIPRAKERNQTIETIVFKGSRSNLYKDFCSSEFQHELEMLGVKLIIHGREEPLMWHDYHTDDLVLAVRDLTEKDALVKPASKLINAWIAGVPALLGPEPAFRDLRRSPLDYIEVTTPNTALDAIRMLKAKPELYQDMVINGQKRAEDFTPEKIAQRWYDILSGPVTDQYKQWKKGIRAQRIAMVPFKALQHQWALKESAHNRKHGYRVVSGQHT